MTAECLSREMLFHASRAPFKKMLDEGIITSEDYAIIDTILHNKYAPLFGGNVAANEVDIVPEQS